VGLSIIVIAASIVAPGMVGFEASDSSLLGSKEPPEPASATVEEGYNLNKTERLFLDILNEERERRGLQTLEQRNELTEMGRAHSRNMAEHDYLGHEEPDGTTIEDRYRERGLLEQCRLPTGGGSYYAGAENAAHYYVDQTVKTSKGELTVSIEQDLARGLYRSWMTSPPHRRAMLLGSADEAGLGLYIATDRKVYASLELC
jgi:uncharacterized protein YkwD